jgi:CBS domain-containing protein
MGNTRAHKEIDASLDGEARHEFMRRLLRDLAALERMVAENRFERGVSRIGAEQEIFLVDRAYHPAPGALDILARIEDPHFTTELGLFNLEINVDAQPLAGQGLANIEAQLTSLYARLRSTCEALDIEPVLVGILPTLDKSDLGMRNMVPSPRYQALNLAMNAERGRAYDFSIRGLDELVVQHETVMFEACNASFQTHLQLSQPERFPQLYNLAQLLVAPLLAAATNSPVFLGRRLWSETRIALFEQSCDVRAPGLHLRDSMGRVSFGRSWVRGSVVDLFRESVGRFRALVGMSPEDDPLDLLEEGRIPKLKGLRLHNGTIYRWNRACYDVSPSGAPHLRIEQRVLPSGPTILDEVGSMALWLGLMVELGETIDDVADRLDFDHARGNLYAAAREGLAARFTWLDGEEVLAQPLLLDRLLPLAQAGLDRAGVHPADSLRYLSVVEKRVRTLRTGSRWMLQSLAGMQTAGPSGMRPTGARASALVAAMISRQRSGDVVADWEPARLDEHDATRSRNHRVSQFMNTDIVTIRSDESVRFAAALVEWEKLRHLPVEDEKGRLVGLLTARGIAAYLAKHGEEGGGDVPVSKIMRKELVTVTPDTLTLDALALARKHSIGCLPVVQDGHLVALLSHHHFVVFAPKIIDQESGLYAALPKEA